MRVAPKEFVRPHRVLAATLLFVVTSCSPKPETAIVGNWVGVRGTERMELFNDGTITVADPDIPNVGGKYTFVDKDRVKVELGGLGALLGPFVVTVAISGDELTWTMPNGEVSKYLRANSAKAKGQAIAAAEAAKQAEEAVRRAAEEERQRLRGIAEKEAERNRLEAKAQRQLAQQAQREAAEKQSGRQTIQRELEEDQRGMDQWAVAEKLNHRADKKAKLIHSANPNYTSAAMKARIEGDVELRVIVDPSGKVSAAQATKSLDSSLDQQAIEAAKRWLFEPASASEQPVPSLVTIALTFRLR